MTTTANATVNGLFWKLRRVAADLRQQDVASRAGMSSTRYSALERGEGTPTELERELIEKVLPQLPVLLESDKEKAHRQMV